MDKDNVASAFFDREVTAKYLRIVPQEWHNRIALRFEVLECPTPTGMMFKKLCHLRRLYGQSHFLDYIILEFCIKIEEMFKF